MVSSLLKGTKTSFRHDEEGERKFDRATGIACARNVTCVSLSNFGSFEKWLDDVNNILRYIKWIIFIRVDSLVKKNCTLGNSHNLAPNFVSVCATLEIAALNRVESALFWGMRVSRERIRRGSPQIARHRLSGLSASSVLLWSAPFCSLCSSRAPQRGWKKKENTTQATRRRRRREKNLWGVHREGATVSGRARGFKLVAITRKSGLNKSSTCETGETMSSVSVNLILKREKIEMGSVSLSRMKCTYIS